MAIFVKALLHTRHDISALTWPRATGSGVCPGGADFFYTLALTMLMVARNILADHPLLPIPPMKRMVILH